LSPGRRSIGIGPGELVEIEARGGASGGGFELEQTTDGLVIYAWKGTMVTILRDATELNPSPQR
jgi:hypothetical protein